MTRPGFHIFYFKQTRCDEVNIMYFVLHSNFQVIKMQQLSLRNVVVQKMLGLPDIKARLGYTAQNSRLDGHKMMQVEPSAVCCIVAIGCSNYMHYVQLSSC